MGSAAIIQLIMLVSDLMVIAPVQYAKLKKLASDGTLTDEQVDQMIAAAEKSSDDLLAKIDSI